MTIKELADTFAESVLEPVTGDSVFTGSMETPTFEALPGMPGPA